MAACAAAILRVCTAGSNVICIKESYGPVQHLLDEFLGPKYNVSVTYVDGRTVKEFEDADPVRNTSNVDLSPKTFPDLWKTVLPS